MAWKSMIPGCDIEDIKADRRRAKSIEQYKVSESALYVKSEYIPISQITGVHIQHSFYTPSCSCGKGIPVFKIRLDCGTDKPVVLMLEKEKNVEKMISMISGEGERIMINDMKPD